MEISKTFVVKASPAAAWDFLTDPRRVASCLPGAAVTEQVNESTYAGTVTVKVGPVSAAYKGTLRFERLDPAARTAELVASGQDVRGKGGADMRMSSRLIERGASETEVVIASQVDVVGVLAQFGRGMIQDVSDQMFRKFVDCMRAQLETAPSPPGPEKTAASPLAPAAPVQAAPSAAPPVDVIALGSAVAGRAALRTARRPIVWIAVLIALALVFWFLHR